MIGLLRLFLVLAGFFLIRRVIASAFRPRPSEPQPRNVRDGRPPENGPVEDLNSGQPIEEAEYEELD